MRELTADLFISLDGFASGVDVGPYFGYHGPELEQEGWITAEWKPTENNRRAKFYSLTRPGRRQLETEAANWERFSAAISHIVQIEEA